MSPTAQPTAIFAPLGPDLDDFPPQYNPLTGLQAPDPALLHLPALLISIPHFPPQARPQAGLSFAPWVFEYLISAGSTRLLGVFYGGYPAKESPLTGTCPVRTEPFFQTAVLLGNRVWLDLDRDGLQDPGEPGVGGVCISLWDAGGAQLLAETVTDSNGFYGFNVSPGGSHSLLYESGDLGFAPQNVGDENSDSDAEPLTGRTAPFTVAGDDLLLDAGLVPSDDIVAAHVAAVPSGEVGPVRSARLVNIHIHDSFQDSCLIYAGSTREIRPYIPHCAEVFKQGDGGVGAMLDISRMVTLAEKNGVNQGSSFNYASNSFGYEAPGGGNPVNRLDVYVAELNQSAWLYDPSVQGWLRYVDEADEGIVGVLHPDTDRLSGRQLSFENLIVLYVDHVVLAPAIIDMNLRQGERGDARLFRDGQMFRLKWSTVGGEYEDRTGFRRPIAFLDQDGKPFPLHPGRSWLIIATPFSQLTDRSPGNLRLRIIAPKGAGLY